MATPNPQPQASLRFGVRALSGTYKKATHELLDIGATNKDDTKVLFVGSEADCKAMCVLFEQTYVAGAEFNANRVVLDGRTYMVTPD